MSNVNVQIPWEGWALVEQIGRGQFGTVYKISCTKYGITEEAAMKIISIPNDPQMIEIDYSYGYDKDSVASKYKSYLDDVLKEYQLMMKVKGNAGIVRCDDISVSPHEDGIGYDVYIRMEFLTSILKKINEISDEESIIKLGMYLCGALDECEKNNILHRDIKPSNILMSDRGDFKLGDFGVSRTLESENTYGTKGIGTYDYMAPEIYNGDKYGKEADIYSLGMVMYWLLNDRTLPFLTKGKAPNVQEITNARQRRFNGDELPRPNKGSDALVDIVLKACSYKPEDRYKTAKEMLDDLLNVKFGSSTSVSATVSTDDSNIEPVEEVSEETVQTVNESVKTAVSTVQNTVDTPTWNDSQETVGKKYSSSNNIYNYDETVGKTYKSKNESSAPHPSKTYTRPVSKLNQTTTKETIYSNNSVSSSDSKSNKVLVFCAVLILVFVIAVIVLLNNNSNNYVQDEHYYSGLDLFNSGLYEDAIEEFKLSNHHDSNAKIIQSYSVLINNSLKNVKIDDAIQYFIEYEDYSSNTDEIKQSFYDYANSYISNSNYESAIKCFQFLGDYHNSNSMISESYYLWGSSLYGYHSYFDAAEKLSKAGNYKDANIFSLYCYGMSYLVKENYTTALQYFEHCGNYNDAADLINVCNAEINVSTGNYTKAQSFYSKVPNNLSVFGLDIQSRKNQIPIIIQLEKIDGDYKAKSNKIYAWRGKSKSGSNYWYYDHVVKGQKLSIYYYLNSDGTFDLGGDGYYYRITKYSTKLSGVKHGFHYISFYLKNLKKIPTSIKLAKDVTLKYNKGVFTIYYSKNTKYGSKPVKLRATVVFKKVSNKKK